MPKALWTKAELRKFDRLTLDTSSRDQMTRIRGRLELTEFIKVHGKEKCDAMFSHLKTQDSQDTD